MPRPAPTRGGFERSRRLLSDPLLQTAARRADIASIRQPGVDDVARFLCGEAASLYCRTQRVHADIEGEDVATVVLGMNNGTTVTVSMAYAENFLEHECFPQTLIFIEGSKGSLELAPDYWLRITTKDGTHARRWPPPRYAWAEPAYALAQASMVPCHANLLRSLQTGQPAQTSGDDNLRTMRLVFGAYDSAARNRVVTVA